MSVLPAADTPPADAASRELLRALRADGSVRQQAVAQLHALLLRAARFELNRRRGQFPRLHDELEVIAHEAAGDAVVSVLGRLDDFRGESRFTTWAYKFVLLETGVKLRKRAWQGREVPLERDAGDLLASIRLRPDEQVEQSELLSALQTGIREVLTPHQRRVLIALALNDVPIDVLADRLGSTRGALYKTLHDARLKLRAHLASCGLPPSSLGRRPSAGRNAL
jgi:RNA polymerase sigma-70 factor (ECF subfamily)